MATIAASRMSADEFLEWTRQPGNVGNHYELEAGAVIEMPPPGRFHGTICFLVARLLGNYLFERGTGSICTNDSGLLIGRNPDTLRGPDVMLFLESEPLEQLSRGYSEVVPNLIVEVFSPYDRWGRMNARVTDYLTLGVPLVWVIDPEERTITVHRPCELTRTLDESDEIQGNGVLPEFRRKVADFFTVPGQRST